MRFLTFFQVVIFGDPDNGKAVGSVPAAKTKVICHAGDNIYQGGDLILTPHLTVSFQFEESWGTKFTMLVNSSQ